MPDGKPNITPVAFAKYINPDKVLITDNYMNQCVTDIKNNSAVTLTVWNPEMTGYKLIGTAQYFRSGEWLEKVKAIPENKTMPCKGALLITITKFFKTA